MSREKKIEEMVEFLNNRINVERNSYFGKGCITLPIIEADKILDILKDHRKQKEGEWEQVGDDHFELCFRCSNCREEFSCEVDMPIFAKFCPNCGAKMKGGE